MESRHADLFASGMTQRKDSGVRSDGRPVAIECTRSAGSFAPGGMLAFRRRPPGPLDLVVVADVAGPFDRRYRALRVKLLGLEPMAAFLSRRTAR
jgi:hypothetical protein